MNEIAAGTAAAVFAADPARAAALAQWLRAVASELGLDLDLGADLVTAGAVDPASVEPLAPGTSPRHHLRWRAKTAAFIVLDAPAADLPRRAAVAAQLAAAGLLTPQLLRADPRHGFALLQDPGGESLQQSLRTAPTPAAADRLMRAAIAALVQWQCGVSAAGWPGADAAQRAWAASPGRDAPAEAGAGPDRLSAAPAPWSPAGRAAWQLVQQRLIDAALAQPRIAVHGDWLPAHLLRGEGALSVLGFEGAHAGPLGADIATLLRGDASLAWDEEREIDWAIRWWEAARRAGLPVAADFSEQWRAIEWLAFQRQLGVIGRRLAAGAVPGAAAPTTATTADAAAGSTLLGQATRVALRYAELAPLLPLLEPLSGARMQSGYTF